MNLTREHFTGAWLVWIIMFFVIELAAVWSDAHRPTLSNHIRDWLRAQSTMIRVSAWVFMITLTFHFLWRLKD